MPRFPIRLPRCIAKVTDIDAIRWLQTQANSFTVELDAMLARRREASPVIPLALPAADTEEFQAAAMIARGRLHELLTPDDRGEAVDYLASLLFATWGRAAGVLEEPHAGGVVAPPPEVPPAIPGHFDPPPAAVVERIREHKASPDFWVPSPEERASVQPSGLDLRNAGFVVDTESPDGWRWRRGVGRNLQTVIAGLEKHDGKRWLHVSTAKPYDTPTHDELAEVKRLFIGADRKAIEVFPPATEHVNQHKHCLHLFACLDGDGLPDFTSGLGSL